MNYSQIRMVVVIGALLAVASIGCQSPDRSRITPVGRGGVELILRLEPGSPQQVANLEIDQLKVRAILERRIARLAVREATVKKVGADGIAVSLPGYLDLKKAIDICTANPQIGFYEAKSVASPRDYSEHRRPFMVAAELADPNDPVVYFEIRNGLTASRLGAPHKFESGEMVAPELKGVKNPKYVAIINSWGKPILDGQDIRSFSYEQAGSGYVPAVEFTAAGAKKMVAWSRRNRFRQENVALVIDGRVINLAPLAEGAVINDRAIITGNFTAKYVANLRDLLGSGALPVPLQIEKASVTPASRP